MLPWIYCNIYQLTSLGAFIHRTHLVFPIEITVKNLKTYEKTQRCSYMHTKG